MAHYGIDLGTSNCLVAKITQDLDDNFDVSCLSDAEGRESFPSVVYFESESKYKIGSTALNNIYEYPDSTIELVKVRLGKVKNLEIKTQNGKFEKSPQEISSYMLSHLNLLHNNQIKNAVITVPAFFNQSQKDATMQAGTIAGMIPKSLIEEPTAAIMFHIFSEYKKNEFDFWNGKENKNVLVFDFGGGTLDLSLIEILKKDNMVVPKVLAIGGDTELGGNIIDFIFTNVILKSLKRKYKDDLFINDVYEAFSNYYENFIDNSELKFEDNVSLEIKNFIFRLKRNLERIKIKLSTSDREEIVFERQYEPFILTREDFEKYVLMSNDINIKEKVIEALDQISKKRLPVSEVLLIGGSSQIPYIKEVIFDAFVSMGITKELIFQSNDFEQAVAKGAAIQAAISDGIAIPPFKKNKCDSIVARDIELEHAGISQIFVPMGTEYPFEHKREFMLKIGHALSETVSLRLNESVIKGNRTEKRQICNFEFFLPIYYTNDDILISMNINEAGLYQVEATHNNTGEAVEFEPHKRFSLSDSEMKSATNTARVMINIT